MRRYTIGRTGCEITLYGDRTSRAHADIEVDGDRITLFDHSSNGTTVNGHLVFNNACPVSRGDVIIFAGQDRLDWGRIEDMSYRQPYDSQPVIQGQTTAPYAVASLVLGILSLVSSYFVLIFAILGLVFGCKGLKIVEEAPNAYKGVGMLRAGKVCSIVALVLWGIIFVIAFIVAGSIAALLS